MIARVLAVTAALAVAVLPVCARAASSKIYSFASSGSSSLTFAVTDMAQPSMLPTSGAASFTLFTRTSPTPGTVTVSLPRSSAPAAAPFSAAAFRATCTATSDSAGMFTSSGTVRLASSAVTCGTLAANTTGTVVFDVTLTLDDTGDAYGFPADTYASSALTVTADLP